MTQSSRSQLATEIMFKPTLCASLVLIFVPSIAMPDWPPQLAEYQKHFETNRSEFDALAAMLLGTRYSSVTVFGEDKAEGWFTEDEHIRRKFLGADEKWRQLLDEAGVFGVSRCDDAICVSLGSSPFKEEKHGVFAYVQGGKNSEMIEPCEAEHERQQTGQCTVHLAGNWWAHYGWYHYTD